MENEDIGWTSRAVGATSGHLLALIRSRAAWTRQQLLEATGMSRPTLLGRLAPLFSNGLVCAAGVEASVGGRPAELIRFDDRRLAVLTMDVGHTHCRVSVIDLAGRDDRRSARSRLDITNTPAEDVVDLLIDLARGLKPGDGDERLIGLGVGLPGPISPVTGTVGQTTIMPGWDTYPLLDRLKAHWDVPIVLENDARALALGEASVHDAPTLLCVKWANGIGAGLVMDGRCLAGDDGAAGDIGHIKVTAGGPRCRCGRRGCLAAYASGHALLGRFRPAGVNTLDEFVAMANANDAMARQVLDAAIRKVGTVLAALIALANPHALVLGGVIGGVSGVVDAVAARVRDVTLHRSTDALRILPSRLGEEAATLGLFRLVVERVLAPEAIDRALASGAPAFALTDGVRS